ncbi:MAG: hypothetical protein A2511_00205 [Deltaproteobacteria bacterium RIFOXYD12_FULL_50_9]|nr:MAG: hypothetical protein A2511_00205 [Deltaproteobacteria bacterium RIFOXYD12_FULL_50_9]
MKESIPNILEDLLGIKADRAHLSTNQELDELTKITHLGRNKAGQKAQSPAPTSDPISSPPPKETEPPASPPQWAQDSPVPQPPPQPVETTTSSIPDIPESEPDPHQRSASLLTLFTVIRLNRKNFQLAITLPDREPCSCAFKNGILVDDYFTDQTNGTADQERSVLLVDAEQSFVVGMAKELTEHEKQFLMLTAATGKQAVRILESKKIDLLITGLKMPEMDGFELLAYIKTHFPALPSLVISTFDYPAMHARIKQLGARQHLLKPINSPALAKHILDILGQLPGKKSIKGMALADFITLLGLSTTSCFVDIFLQGKDHFLCRVEKGFIQGISCGSAKGELAIRETLSWNEFLITFRQTPF